MAMNLAVERVNTLGGVKVGKKSYNWEIVYYDDESTSRRDLPFREWVLAHPLSRTHV